LDNLVSVPFASGVDTKSDPRVLSFGPLTTLENGVFHKTGAIHRRSGHDVLGRVIFGSTEQIDAAVGVASFGDELLLFGGRNIYSWLGATENWVDRGTIVPVTAVDHQIIRNSSQQVNPDVARLTGLRLVAWEDSRGGVRYSIQDEETGAFLVHDTELSATGENPKTVSFAEVNEFVVFYTIGNNLHYKRIGRFTPQTLGSQQTATSALSNNNPRYDAIVLGARLFYAYNKSSGTEVAVSYLDSSYAPPSGGEVVFSDPGSACVGVWSDPSLGVFIGYSDGTNVRLNYVTHQLDQVGGGELVETGLSGVRRITGTADASLLATVLYEVAGSTDSLATIRSNTVDYQPGTVGTAFVLKRSIGLTSKLFAHGDTSYFVGVHESTLQSTYFVLDIDGNIIARISPTTAGGLRDNRMLSEVSDYEFASQVKGRLVAAAGYVYAQLGVNTTALSFSTQSIATATVDKNLVIAGGCLNGYDGISVVEHGFHLFPEGLTVAESSGFLITTLQHGNGVSLPEITQIVSVAGNKIVSGQGFRIYNMDFEDNVIWYNVDGLGDVAGGSSAGIIGQTVEVAILSSDTREQVAAKTVAAINAQLSIYYTAVYTGSHIYTVEGNSVDNTGNGTNLAAPMGVGTSLLTAAGSYAYRAVYEWTDAAGHVHRSAPSNAVAITSTGAAVGITVPALRLTAKSDVRIAIYRTAANGTVYYRITPMDAPANDPTADYVYYADGWADTDITGNELLYTTGGVLDHVAPPSSTMLASYRGRIFLAGTQDPTRIYYSTETVPGEAVAFNDALTIDMETDGGPVTALGVLDQYLVIFKRNSIYVITGDGPTNTGDLPDYGTPTNVATDVGCATPASVVLTPAGLMFKSAKGIYVLTRGLSVEYVGAPVEEFNDQTVTGAQVVADRNEVRFVCESGNALVYNYLVGQWSTFTNHQSVGCTVWQDSFVFAKSNGRVYRENRDVWADGGTGYSLKLVTAWLQTAGILGYQRVKRAWVLGDYKGRHQLRLRFGYDYDDSSWPDEKTIDAYDILNPGTYGSVSPYGGDPVYGGHFPDYRFGLHLRTQKCGSIRVEISDIQSTDYNEGLSLSAIAFQVGAKRGGPKLPSARSLGSASA
jgi:hypothetical protein